MADYYVNKLNNDLGGEFAEPITFRNMEDNFPEIILENLKQVCESNNIPATFTIATVEISEGLFRKTKYSGVEVRHPNPPQEYCRLLFLVIPGGGVKFHWVGKSKAFSEMNNYEAAVNGQSYASLKGKAQAFFGIKPDDTQYKLELEWDNLIYTAFISLLE